MKKTLLVFALAVATMVSAQIVEVESVSQLSMPAGSDLKVAGLSPDGSYVLLTSQTNKGLQKMDVATGAVDVITEAEGAGYNAQISEDGKNLLYREVKVGADRLRRSSLIRREINAAADETIVANSRELEGYMISGNTILAVNKRKAQTRRLDGEKTAVLPVASISNRQLVITKSGATQVISPLGTDKSYIWPSVSPDGKHVCFYVCGDGAYVSDIYGKDVKRIAHDCRAAKWLDNNTIIAMADKDNGEVVTSSAIVAYTLDGQKQVLTNNSIIAMYPYPQVNGKLIVCSSTTGEAYMIKLK